MACEHDACQHLPAAHADELTSIQEQLDNLNLEFAKNDFDVKLAHHNKIEPILKARNTIFREKLSADEFSALLKNALGNTSIMQELLPIDAQHAYDSSFIRFITAEYLPEYQLRVTLELNKNPYLSDEKLVRTISLLSNTSESVKLNRLDENAQCPLFEFFEAEEDDLEAFDIIYDFYVNMVEYVVHDH